LPLSYFVDGIFPPPFLYRLESLRHVPTFLPTFPETDSLFIESFPDRSITLPGEVQSLLPISPYTSGSSFSLTPVFPLRFRPLPPSSRVPSPLLQRRNPILFAHLLSPRTTSHPIPLRLFPVLIKLPSFPSAELLCTSVLLPNRVFLPIESHALSYASGFRLFTPVAPTSRPPR